MGIEEIKKKTIEVQYLYKDKPPKEGMKRMTYFTNLSDNGDIFYHGFSFRESAAYSKKNLENWVKEGYLWKLENKIIISWEKDLFLTSKKELLLAKGYAPWTGGKVVADLSDKID